MVNKTWHLVEQHGCWWAYEGELPPAGGIHDAQTLTFLGIATARAILTDI
jgi:hypothetical protein